LDFPYDLFPEIGIRVAIPKLGGIRMPGDPLARQWRVIRAIEASLNGLTFSEIAKRGETGTVKLR